MSSALSKWTAPPAARQILEPPRVYNKSSSQQSSSDQPWIQSLPSVLFDILEMFQKGQWSLNNSMKSTEPASVIESEPFLDVLRYQFSFFSGLKSGFFCVYFSCWDDNDTFKDQTVSWDKS